VSSTFRWLPLLAAIAGCLGNPTLVPDSDTEDGSGTEVDDDGDTDVTESGTDDTEGDGGMELLVDGSFEMWAGEMPAVWTYNSAMLERTDEDVVDGSAAVRVVSASRETVGQTVAQPIAMGDCLEVEASVRWISGATDEAPGGLIQSDDCGECTVGFPLAWSADGEWSETDMQLPPSAYARANFRFSLGSNTLGAQTLDFDAVSLKIVPCE
jgi:hypothetical protein